MAGSTNSGPTTRHKRKKPDTDDSVVESSTTQIAITRSPDFWYDDGTIVLQVETTQFRVHRGVLASHSAFFADMFKIPQPQNEPLVEDCQVVCIPDEVEDWEQMLTVMYQPMRAHPLLPDLRTSQLLSILRLGKKYQFDVLYDGALKRLKSELPSSLDDFSELNGKLHTGNDCTEDDEYCFAMACCTWNLFKLINVAVELNAGIVLPVAYYLACSNNIQAVVNGSESAPGTLMELSRDPQKIILVGRDRVRKAIMDEMFPWIFGKADLPVPSKECRKPQVCLKIFSDATKVIAYTAIAMEEIDLYFHESGWDKMCRACNRDVDTFFAAGREKFWDKLPSYFDLPAWDVLEAQ